MELAEIRLGRPLAEVIVTDFGDKSHAEIAEALGISERTVLNWLKRLGIERRLVLVHPVDGEADCAAPRPPDGSPSGGEAPAPDDEVAA